MLELVFDGVEGEVSVRVEVPQDVQEHYSGFYVEEGHLYVSFEVNDLVEVWDDGFSHEEYATVISYDCGKGFEYLEGLEPYYHLEV